MYNSFNHKSNLITYLFYVVICPTCGENYTGKTGNVKAELRDRIQVYQQHIKQSQYKKLKVAENLRACIKGTFKIFFLLQMQSSGTDLSRSYERNVMKVYKPKFNGCIKLIDS